MTEKRPINRSTSGSKYTLKIEKLTLYSKVNCKESETE